jgi:hypothetical protein
VVRPADNREVMCSNHIGPILFHFFIFFQVWVTGNPIGRLLIGLISNPQKSRIPDAH